VSTICSWARSTLAGVAKQACLEHLPELAIGDYVLVHVGFALAKLDEAEAKQIFTFLEAMNDLGELTDTSPQRS